MPAYVIVMRKSPVEDADSMAEYQRRTRSMNLDVPVKPRVVYGALEALEGDAPEGVVMLEFDTMDQAKAWYHSDEYQAALPYRLKSADYEAFIVEGLNR